MEISRQDWQSILESFPTAHYGWMFRLARWRMKQNRSFPYRLNRVLSRLASKKRPYFIGTTREGVRFLGDIRDYDSWRWMLGNAGDDQVVNSLVAIAQPGVFVDIGTNIGVLAATVSRKSCASVIAFEAVGETARRAAATFALNETDARLFQCAIGDRDGDLVIHRNAGHSGGASAVRAGGITETVPMRCLDSFALPPVGIIKIDVEGFEPQVIAGARGTISRDRPPIVYEWNTSQWTPQAANAAIAAAGGDYNFTELGTADEAHLDVVATPVHPSHATSTSNDVVARTSHH